MGWGRTGNGADKATAPARYPIESNRRPAEWVRTNLPNAKIAPPQVIEGDGVFRFAAADVAARA